MKDSYLKIFDKSFHKSKYECFSARNNDVSLNRQDLFVVIIGKVWSTLHTIFTSRSAVSAQHRYITTEIRRQPRCCLNYY